MPGQCTAEELRRIVAHADDSAPPLAADDESRFLHARKNGNPDRHGGGRRAKQDSRSAQRVCAIERMAGGCAIRDSVEAGGAGYFFMPTFRPSFSFWPRPPFPGQSHDGFAAWIAEDRASEASRALLVRQTVAQIVEDHHDINARTAPKRGTSC